MRIFRKAYEKIFGKETKAPAMSFVVPSGKVSFEDIISRNFFYIDKTLLIKDILDEHLVLITRPRRFGKTLNMNMLRCFFEKSEPSKSEPSKRALFDSLNISKHPECMKHQGLYPVVNFTFKDIKEDNWDDCFKAFASCIAKEYKRHKYLQESLDEYDIELWRKIMTRTADSVELSESVQTLTMLLHEFHGEKAIVLIDEYDAPIHAAYKNGYHDKALDFYRNLFTKALKDNDEHVEKGVITGVLRVTKQSLFSDLNNLRVYSVLNSPLSDRFGFTEAEVMRALDFFGLGDQAESVKKWYNGYKLPKGVVYNPWSVINFLKDKEFQTYWVGTGEDVLASDLVGRHRMLLQENLDLLLCGESIAANIKEGISFKTLAKSREAVWTILLYSGYVTVAKSHESMSKIKYLEIPNYEVATGFKDSVSDWLADVFGSKKLEDMLKALVAGDIKTFQELLRCFTKNIFSYHDIPKNESEKIPKNEPEKIWHIFFLGLLINLESKYKIRSNRESGLGRYDIAMFPLKPEQSGIIMEFKKIKAGESPDDVIAEAFAQIEEKKYDAEFDDKENVMKIAVAIRGKEVFVKRRKT